MFYIGSSAKLSDRYNAGADCRGGRAGVDRDCANNCRAITLAVYLLNTVRLARTDNCAKSKGLWR